MRDEIKLIASSFSPYCQRVEILLAEKEIAYKRQEINLSNRPDWFLKNAPFGKVPLLYIGDKILFESMVICEYLNEDYGLALHSQDRLIKAIHRGWIEFSNLILSNFFTFISAKTMEAYDRKKLELVAKLAILDKNLKYNPYFDGDKYLLIDIAMTPIFKLMVTVENKFRLEIFDNFPKLAAYAENLVTRHSLGRIIPKNYDQILTTLLENKDCYLLKRRL